jgi:protein O-mannosyl-transferase
LCTARDSSYYYGLSLVFFALGLMSKPMVVTLPFVLLLLDYWPLQRLQVRALRSSRFKVQSSGFEVPAPAPPAQPSTLWSLVREKMPFFALALAASVVTYLVQQAGGAVSSLEAFPFRSRLANALIVYVRYLSQGLWPAELAVPYPYSRHLPFVAAVFAVLLLVGLSSWFLLRAKRQPFLIVGWLWYLGTLVPTIGLVQVGSQSMADRYTYIPSIGLFLLIVWGLDALVDSWQHKPFLLSAAGTLALAGCLACTWNQLKYWQDSERLFRHAIAATTANYTAYDGLGNTLEASGKHEEALACYAEAVRLKPDYPEAHINFGKALLGQGRPGEALVHLRKAVGLTPADPEAQYNLGTVLLMQAKPEEAIACFSEALRLKPDYAEAHSNLGVVLMRQGKLGEGATHFTAALRLNPNDPEAYYNLGLALLELNHPREAADYFSEALRFKPNAPETHYHLALALDRQDKPKEALPHAQKARDLALAAGQPALAAKAEELLKLHP